MSDPWYLTALTRLETELEADAVLSQYVDAVEIGDVDRAEDAPSFTRHGIRLCPRGLTTPEVHSPVTTVERFAVDVHLFALIWDPTDVAASVTGTTIVGVGTSTVGILKFTEDVCNALRRNTLSSLLEESGVEIERNGIDWTQRANPARDRIYQEARLVWTGEHVSPMART